MDNFSKIRQLMVDVFQIPENDISMDTKQDDLISWDSVGHLNLMLTVEQEFGVALEVEDLSRLTSVAAILEYLNTNEHAI